MEKHVVKESSSGIPLMPELLSCGLRKFPRHR
jgi:hypothetical protein